MSTLLEHVAAALHGSPFEKPSTWPCAVVVLRHDETRATTRADLASFFTANDLPVLARECMNRKVPRGRVLVFVDIDHASVAATGFLVFDLAGAAARKTA